MKIYLSKCSLAFMISAATLLLGNRFCFADTCPNDVEAKRPLEEETLDHAYQPPDGDILHRYRFVPSTGGPKWPTVLMLPPDEFNMEYGDNGVPSERWATHDLQEAGFLVFQVDHRLAPPGALTGQAVGSSSGRPPQQTDDLKRQIMAALADSQCNGSIYLVGGSAGGCLSLWVMLDATPVVNLAWNDAARTKIKAVVSLSGPAKMIDWSYNSLYVDDPTHFEDVADNYVGLPNGQDTEPLGVDSPFSLVTSALSSSPPVMLYATYGDPAFLPTGARYA
jgi:acetyl esterase/lipase